MNEELNKNSPAEELLNIPHVKQYIESRSNMLNGQLRGFINGKAREENLELILITFNSIITDIYNLGSNDGYLKRSKEEASKEA